MLGEGWLYEEAVAFVERCYERTALLEVLLGFALEHFEAAWIGLISGEQLLIQRGAGRWATLGERLVPLSAWTLRALCASEPSWHVVNTRALRALAPLATSRKELVLMPLNIAGRAVVALGGAPRIGVSGLAALDQLTALSKVVSAQLESFIMLAKQGKLPPAAERVPPSPRPPKARPKPPPIPTLRKLARPPQPPIQQLVAQDLVAADIPEIKSKEELPHHSVNRTMLGGFEFYKPAPPPVVVEAPAPAAPPAKTTQPGGATYKPAPEPRATPGAMILKGARKSRRATHGEARRTLQNMPLYKPASEDSLAEASSSAR